MPTIRVELFEGRTVEQKRAFAQALTEAAVKTIGSSADSVDVLFYDIAKQDWATGGKLWCDDGEDSNNDDDGSSSKASKAGSADASAPGASAG